jgi:hypothetical protein
MSDTKTEATEKPLEKMTVKALREIAKEIPEITGVHGMKKEELLVAINEARGVNAETAEAETGKADKSIKGKPVKKAASTTGEIKKKIKALKELRKAALGAQDRKMATVYKRRISRLKKQSRKAAA